MFKNINEKNLTRLIEGTVRDVSHNKVTTRDCRTGELSLGVDNTDRRRFSICFGLFSMTSCEPIGDVLIELTHFQEDVGYICGTCGGHVKRNRPMFRAVGYFFEDDEVDEKLYFKDEIGADVMELCVSKTETAIRNICAEYDL